MDIIKTKSIKDKTDNSLSSNELSYFDLIVHKQLDSIQIIKNRIQKRVKPKKNFTEYEKENKKKNKKENFDTIFHMDDL